MASEFAKESMKMVVAKVADMIGFQGINTIPLEVLSDLLHRYMQRLAIDTRQYAEHCGRTTPTACDLEMTFKGLGINSASLEDYVSSVESTPFPVDVPKIPVPRSSNLNFLKPGSQEILSRPINIHDHLPPMHPVNDDGPVGGNDADEDSDLDKRMESPSSPAHPSNRYRKDDEGQPVREIDSIMMTTSGFISSSRAGRLPEARPPNIPLPLIHTSKDALAKKKVATMEKIKQNKSSQSTSSVPSRSRNKDGKIRPKIPGAPPGTGFIKNSSPKIAPKLKMPTPKAKPADDPADPSYHSSEGRKDESRSKERSRDGKREELKEFRLKERKRERIRMRMRGLSKEEELKRYKEREEELLAALEASKVTTMTPPPLRVREKTPDLEKKRKSSSIKRVRNIDPMHPPNNSSNMMIDIKDIKEERIEPSEDLSLSMTDFRFESPLIMSPLRHPSTPSPTERSKHRSKASSRKSSPSKSPKRAKKSKVPLKPSGLVKSTPMPEPPQSTYVPSPPSDASSSFALPVIPNNPSFIPSFTKFEKSYHEIVDERSPPVPSFSSLYDPMPSESEHGFLPPQEAPHDTLPTISKESPVTAEPPRTSSSKPEKRKEHKKDKKNKDRDSDHSKSKKKKDKKDKERSKEEKKRLKEQLKQEKKEKKRERKEEVAVVPKITVKFQTDEGTSQLSNVSGSMEPPKPPKLVIKPIRKTVEEESNEIPASRLRPEDEPGSPEIAKISPLMTRPSKASFQKKSPSRPTVPPLKIRDPTAKRSEKKEKKRKHSVMMEPEKREEQTKTEDSFSCSVLPEEPPRKQRKFSPPESPARKKRQTGLLTETEGPIGHFVDDQGNEVWICPHCGKQDDGSPMIGCDTCDDWYHWVCVGISIMPSEKENWYCPRCLAKRRDSDSHDKKKKNRKRKST